MTNYWLTNHQQINKTDWKIETNYDYLDGETECICGHNIKYLFYITHIPTVTTFKVGSICVLKISDELYQKSQKLINDKKKLENGNSVCEKCNIILRKNAKIYYDNDDKYNLCYGCSKILDVRRWKCLKPKYKNILYKDLIKIDPNYCIFLIEKELINKKIIDYILLKLNLEIQEEGE